MSRFLLASLLLVVACVGMGPRMAPADSWPAIVGLLHDPHYGSVFGDFRVRLVGTDPERSVAAERCSTPVAESRTDSAGIFVIPAGRVTIREGRLCLAQPEMLTFFSALAVPPRTRASRDTVWLECILHTGYTQCEHVERTSVRR